MGKSEGSAMRKALTDKREAFRNQYMRAQKKKKGSFIADAIQAKGAKC